jgi:dTDP-4-amino-4,6-dideoxygalactose transaminase
MKHSIDDLAIFGGQPAFDTIRSISNLLRPDIEQFLGYCKTIYDTKQLTDNGALVQQMEERFAQLHGTQHCVAFCSGFMALQVAMYVCAIPDKTEVVMPSLTYRRMADIAAWAGLIPHFCDVDVVSLGMTAKTAKNAINDNTALILGVHPITNLCDINGLEALSHEHGIPLLFDSVEAAYAEHNGKMVGGFGRAEVFSLHASKLLNGFEGGYITTDDDSLAKVLRCVRNFGFDEKQNIVRLGLNAKLNELHAAMVLACLDIFTDHISQNRARHNAWQQVLADLPCLTLLLYSDTEQRGYKNVVVRCEDSWPLSRENTLRTLHAENMLARPYYNPPLHELSRKFPIVCNTDLSVTEEVTTQYMLLPSGDHVSVEDITVMGNILIFVQEHGEKITRRIEENYS